MTQPVDVVYVELRVDDDTLPADMKKSADNATKNFQKTINDNLKGVEDDFAKSGERSGQAFGDGFVKDANGRLRDSRGKFVKDGLPGIEDEAGQAGGAAGAQFGEQFTRDAQGRLRDGRGRFVSEGGASGDSFGNAFRASARRHGNQSGLDFGNAFQAGLKGPLAAVTSALQNFLRIGAGFGDGPLSRILSGGYGAGLAVTATGIAGIGAAAAQTIPLLAAFAVELANAAGAALIIPGVLATAAAVIATFKIGLMGVGDALKAVVGAQSAAGESAAEYGRRVKAAQETLVQANQRVADSERDLAKATEAVNDARQTAADQIADRAEDIDDARRDERGAILDLTDAEAELRRVQADVKSGKATAQDLERAQLAYDNAADRLDDIQKRIKKLAKEQADANKKGVEGSDLVQDALERQAQAQRNLATAKRAAIAAEEAFAAAQERTAAGVDKAADAMAKLAPAGREVVEALLQLKTVYEGLQRTVQQALLAGVAEELRQTGTQLLPVATAGFAGLAEVINRQVVASLQALRQESVKLDLASIFTSARATLDNFTPAFAPLITALVDVAEVGARVLTSITEGAGDAIARFAGYVSDLAASGQLEQIILNGIEVLKAFGAVAADVFGILKSIFTAAETINGSGFTILLDQLNGFLSSTAGQEALVGFFQEVNRVVEALFPVLEAVVAQLPALAGAFAEIAIAVGPALVTVVQALGPALASLGAPLASLAPAIAALAVVFQPLATILGNLIVALAPALTAVLEAVGAALTNLIPAAFPVGQAIAALLTAVAPLLPLLAQLATTVLVALAGALTNMAVTLGPLISLFADAFTQALQTFLPIITQLIATELPIFVQLGLDLAQAFAPLVPVILQVAQAIAQAFLAAAPQLLGLLTQLVPVLVQFAQALSAQLIVALQALIPYIPQIIDLFVQMTGAFLEFGTQLLTALIPYLPQLVEAFLALIPPLLEVATALAPLLLQVFASLVPLLPPLVESWLALVVAFTEMLPILTPLIVLILEAVTAILKWATESGALKIVFQSLMFTLNLVPLTVAAIVSGFRGLIDAIGAAAAAVGRFIGTVTSGLLQALRDIGTLLGQLPGLFSNLTGSMVTAGKNLITGFINGISEMVPRLFGYVRDIGTGIVDFFNSALGNASPSKLAKAAGVNFLKGADQGLEAELPDVRRTVTQVADVIQSAVPAPGGRGGHAEQRAMGPVTVVAQFGTERFTALATTAAQDTQRRTARKVLAKPRSV